MTYPSGAVVSYLRDSTGRITGVTAKPTASGAAVTVVSDVDYLPFGPATLMTFGNGRTLDKTYDANYGIEAIADSAVDGVALDFTLDAVGNVTGLDERLAGGGTTTRTVDYDDLDRLEALKDGATTVQGFTYDATGNRTSETAGSPEAYAYPTTSHRLTQTGATARGYDAAGNTTAIGSSRVFTYDDRGRMSRLTDGGVLTRQYVYNGRGERVAKRNPTVPAGDVLYVYDETGRLLGEYEIGGARIKEYVWLDDTLVAVLGSHGGSSHQYVLTDHLGTPRAVVHPGTNAIVWRWNLTGSAFGDHAAQNDPDGDTVGYTFNLRYPGQYYDEETGLHYNYFRDYDPGTGRYVQSDPIGLIGGNSTFGYVGSSPVRWSDPYGLMKWRGTGVGGGASLIAFGGSSFTFDLESECIRGKKYRVLVEANSAGLGIGLPRLPVGGGEFGIELDDNIEPEWLDHLSQEWLDANIPMLFDGLFVYVGAGASVGNLPWGSKSAFQFGDARQPVVSTSITNHAALDISANAQFGTSRVKRVQEIRCDCAP